MQSKYREPEEEEKSFTNFNNDENDKVELLIDNRESFFDKDIMMMNDSPPREPKKVKAPPKVPKIKLPTQ